METAMKLAAISQPVNLNVFEKLNHINQSTGEALRFNPTPQRSKYLTIQLPFATQLPHENRARDKDSGE